MIYKVLDIQKVVGLGISEPSTVCYPHFSCLVVAGAEVRMIWGEELEDGCVLPGWLSLGTKKQQAQSKVLRCVLRQEL